MAIRTTSTFPTGLLRSCSTPSPSYPTFAFRAAPRPSPSRARTERFLAEIETTAKLTHPHILPLFDSGEADSFLFFVAPYIEGDTLRDKIDREKQLSIDEALKITEKVASALDYAHKHGVVHR